VSPLRELEHTVGAGEGVEFGGGGFGALRVGRETERQARRETGERGLETNSRDRKIKN
jgi:hypothetical protein